LALEPFWWRVAVDIHPNLTHAHPTLQTACPVQQARYQAQALLNPVRLPAVLQIAVRHQLIAPRAAAHCFQQRPAVASQAAALRPNRQEY